MAELQVRMPALSATMEDALVLSWLVGPGDVVRSGQPLAEVSTDKVDMELESPYDGTVDRILVPEGERADLGAPLLVLTSDEEDLLGGLDLDGSGEEPAAAPAPAPAAAPAAAPAPAAPAPAPAAAPAATPAAIVTSPLVRRLARERGIDLRTVTGTGSRGQITRADLEAAGAGGAAPGVTPDSPRTSTPAAAPAGGNASRRRAIRAATARTTVRSAQIPQFTLYRRIDAGRVNERREGRSWSTELARALAAALWRHPECNAVWDDEQQTVVPLPGVRVGIAVDTPDGLVVVAVDDPDAVAPAQADAAVRAAVDRGRNGRIVPEDMQDVSTTISNLGGLGVDRFNALLVPPQPTILSVGRIVETPVVLDGHVRVRPMMEVGLTVDHRVADGADGARFLETFIQRLEG